MTLDNSILNSFDERAREIKQTHRVDHQEKKSRMEKTTFFNCLQNGFSIARCTKKYNCD